MKLSKDQVQENYQAAVQEQYNPKRHEKALTKADLGEQNAEDGAKATTTQEGGFVCVVVVELSFRSTVDLKCSAAGGCKDKVKGYKTKVSHLHCRPFPFRSRRTKT